MDRTRVFLFDDDDYALTLMEGLLTRDERTIVCGKTRNAAELVRLARNCRPERVLLEADYFPQCPPLYDLLTALREAFKRVPLICHAKTATPENVRAALLSGAQGFLLKQDVSLALVPALLRGQMDRFIITSGVEKTLKDLALAENLVLEQVPTWRPNPNLSPKLLASFFARAFFGMRASSVADRMVVKTQTIEKYMTNAYEILEGDYSAEDKDFEGIEMEKLSPEERALLWFTALPRQKRK